MPRKSPSFASATSRESEGSSSISIQPISMWERLLQTLKDHRFRIVSGVLLCAFALFSLGAVFSFFHTGQADQSLITNGTSMALEGDEALRQYQNCFGSMGAHYARWLVDGTFGLTGLIWVVMCALYGLRLLHVLQRPGLRLFFVGSFWMVWGSFTLAYIQTLFHIGLFFRLGGALGEWASGVLLAYIQLLGVAMLIVVSAIVFLVLTSSSFVAWVQRLWEKMHRHAEEETTPVVEDNASGEGLSVEIIPMAEEPKEVDGPLLEPVAEDGGIKVEIEPIPMDEVSTDPHSMGDLPGVDTDVHDVTSEDGEEGRMPLDIEGNEVEIVEQMEDYDPHMDLSSYQYPPLELLKVYDNETAPVINQAEQQANADRIVSTLRNYEVEVESIKATVGPTVTLYEIVPKAGTRISRIQNLENDIMLSLSAIGIRIIAPMPGKGTVGIEVPNEKPQVVSMHSVIASKRFQEEQKMKLPVAIGRTITNDIFCFDLAKTPHLLVAGATGQGKSVGLNAIITSLLYKKHPSELKFVLVDPKMVEFSVYKPLIRHYLAAMPDQEDRDIIITDSQKVINTLNSLVIEMEDRYSLLADASVRTLEDYNEKFIHRRLNPEKVVENLVTHKPLHHHYMPYIVIIIDEYGDFIMVSGKEVERPIQRLTQKARAVGMHMVLATQRPDVKIVTGTIKANVPTRIAFRTQSVVDSRTVLDSKGADQLIGKGDMLYSGGGSTTRIQCAFVDTPEVEKIVEHIAAQQHYSMPYQLPDYVPEGGDTSDGGSQAGEVDMKRLDPMFAEVARYVVNKQEGSTSRLQRAFEIGYNRAGKLSDQLEAAGVVGPNKGPKGRDVLIQDPESLENLLQSLGL